MDPLTHASFGVACALVAAGRNANRGHVALAGLAGGLLPDVDIFFTSKSDPLFNIEYHRHFTHSVVLSPLMALLAAGITWLLLFRQRAAFRSLFWPAWVAVLSHIFCDLWTSYGTRAAWPFTDTRYALHWISVVDPLLTLPLIAMVLWAVWRLRQRAVWLGLIWTTAYLTLGIVQKQRAAAALESWVTEQGNEAAVWRTQVKPSFANLIVWRALAEKNGRLQVFAIRCGLGAPVFLPGESTRMFADAEAARQHYGLPVDSGQARDIRRFHHFSDGWVGPHPEDPSVLADLRYAALPNEVAPMWGIRMKPDQPGATIDWVSRAGLNDRPWGKLWAMISGNGSATTQPAE